MFGFFSNRLDLPFQKPPGIADNPIHLFDCPGNRFQVGEQLALPAQAWYRKVGVLHCPHGSLLIWQPIPTVVALHDTLPWDEPEMPRNGYLDHLLPLHLIGLGVREPYLVYCGGLLPRKRLAWGRAFRSPPTPAVIHGIAIASGRSRRP